MKPYQSVFETRLQFIPALRASISKIPHQQRRETVIEAKESARLQFISVLQASYSRKTQTVFKCIQKPGYSLFPLCGLKTKLYPNNCIRGRIHLARATVYFSISSELQGKK